MNNFQLQSQKHVSAQAGFTLIELMVSISLFIIVVIVLIGSLYTVNDASRKVQAMRTVMDNLNFAMEAMGRTIRTSENISCNGFGNCPLSGAGSTLIAMDSTLGEYRRVEYRLVQANGRGMIQKKSTGLILDTSTPNPQDYMLDVGDVLDWQAITAPEIDIDALKFYVDGASRTDEKQPSVMIKLDGVASVLGGTTVPFSIQTYLSQRTPE